MKLFGTDGVRGRVEDFLTPELAFGLGRAAATAFKGDSPQVLVVRDTRASGEMLESALCAGNAAGGGSALLAGVLPTPAASILVRRLGLDMAAVISASHNPYWDNGIKFFDKQGQKFSDDAESAVEEMVLASAPGIAGGRVRAIAGTLEDYLRELASRFNPNLDGLRVLLDCANGATYRAAPLIFERLGASIETIACEPSGTNINDGCGSTHAEVMVEALSRTDCDIAFAFDGDGDRVLAADRSGRIVDGDEIIARIALHLHATGKLAGDGVAVTVMTNYGFHQAMEGARIEVATTKVGDRYVVEELFERGWILGGEQSGHIIDLRFTPSGDGIAAALELLEALGGRDLGEVEVMRKYPQSVLNVPVRDRDSLEASSSVWEAVAAESEALEGRGRVLVRPSGTEPVVRVMAEAPTKEESEAVVGRIAQIVDRELGSAPSPSGS